mmetsp:Transcript_22234/g.37153  ORF Transcript_22234/g.37153 Transcript_22234/m.37153 type:complete len:203 (+) Transcript_22234:443-1051(+)
MVAMIAYWGSRTAFRIMMMSGMLACRATNHSGENLTTCSRQAPIGTFVTKLVAATAASRTPNSCGRNARMGGVAAKAARSLMIAEGQVKLNLNFAPIGLPPGGGGSNRSPRTSRRIGILEIGHLLSTTGAVSENPEVFEGGGCSKEWFVVSLAVPAPEDGGMIPAALSFAKISESPLFEGGPAKKLLERLIEASPSWAIGGA